MPKQKGFSLLLVIVILALLGTAVFFIFHHSTEENNSFQKPFSPGSFQGNNHSGEGGNMADLSSFYSRGQCQGKGTKEFGSPPMNITDIGSIVPLGLMVDAHVTPIDHIYFSPKNFRGPRDEYPVFAIADGTIVDIEHRTNFVGDINHSPGGKTDEYRVVFEYSCSFYSYYDLLTSLSPSILSQAGNLDDRQNQPGPLRIPVKEGQEIGRIGGQTLDFSVWNTDVTLTGFIVPAHYQMEPWKIHTDDPFKYFKEPIKDQLLALDERTVEPRQGKIDYDIDGKLVGNWFKVGTGGYDYERTNPQSFWTSQLSIVYDHLDPSEIIVSIGDYNGAPKQFAVKGNAPDPATIDKNSGLIKYELVNWNYIDSSGRQWDGSTPVRGLKAASSGQVEGVVLVQMTGDRQIKFEAFPGKSAPEVNGFDQNAQEYER